MDEVKHVTLVIVLPRGHHHLGDGFPDGQCVGLEGVDVCGGIITAVRSLTAVTKLTRPKRHSCPSMSEKHSLG